MQASSQRQSDQMTEKFSKERRDLNDKIEQLSSEISKRERAVLQLENQKEGLQTQIRNKDKEIEELKSERTSDKNTLLTKIEDLKAKYDKAMDELTQTKIDNEREKALKD